MPLVSKTFDQLLDFTRTSAATYVGSNGLIQNTPASRNLLLQTQQFDDAAWSKTNTTVAANSAVAPDGTSTADTLTANASAGAGQQTFQTITNIGSGNYVYSIYVKQGSGATDSNSFLVRNQTTGVNPAVISFNYQTGVVTQTEGYGATAASVGNGWWRLSIPFTLTATIGNAIRFYAGSSGAVETPGEFFYAWGAQVEAVPAANLVLGSELVTNGTFAGASTTGWTAAGSATISGTGDVLTVTNGATAFGYAVTSITTIVGRTYYVTYQVTGGTSTGNLYIGTASGGFDNYAGPNQGVGSYTVAFVATATTTYLRLGNSVNTSGATFIVDNISTKEITAITGMPTTYTRNNGGVFPPRFEYDPVTLAPKGLLIEEQRTNLLLRSEEFDNASWTKSNATVTANAAVSPDGATDADKLVEDTANTSHYVVQSAGTIGNTEVHSVYAKAAERTWLYMSLGAGKSAYFNLATGVLGTASGATATITAAGNGWYRCTISGARATNSNNIIAVASADNVLGYTGDGTSGIFIYGAQLEAGAFATSYIPTVASQVTRSADVCSIVAPNFAPWYNQSEGTIVADVSPANNGSYALAITDGTANEEIVLRYASSGTAAVIRDGGAIQANFGTGVLTGKNALAYKVNDFAVSTNGGAAATDTSGTVPTNDQIRLGAARDGTLNINGHIRSIRYYPTRLTNAQLQALTA